MTDERDVARIDRELMDLRAEIRRIDEQGTRGILPLSVQMAEVIKDVAKMESSLERKLRTNWGAVLAYIGGIAPVYAFIIQQLLQARGH